MTIGDGEQSGMIDGEMRVTFDDFAEVVAERDAAMARCAELERLLKRGEWLRRSMVSGVPGGVLVDQLKRVAAAGEAEWMGFRGVDRVSGRKRVYLSAHDEFWLRASGQWKSRGMDNEAAMHCAHSFRLPMDHSGTYFRDKTPVVITSQAYLSSWDDNANAAWEEAAERYGLTLERSVASSWYYPGRTVLYALWLPGAYRAPPPLTPAPTSA